MHRALTVPDILLHIISHVESKDTLGALARTSSLVSGPALDELWHTIDSLVLLARCMPPEVWDEVVLPTYQCTSLLFLSEGPTEGDWLGPRFGAYARRIRHLNIANRVVDHKKWPVRRSSWEPPLNDHCTDPDALRIPVWGSTSHVTSTVHLDVLHAWCKYSRDVAPLFPNLSHIKWSILSGYRGSHQDPRCNESSIDPRELTPLFLGPSLSSLAFGKSARHVVTSVHGEAEEVPHIGVTALVLLQEAMVRCPSLDSIALHKGHRILLMSQRIPVVDAAFSSRLQHLRTFRCGVLAPNSTLRLVASLAHLETFAALVGPELSLAGLPRVFPAARELRFLCTSLRQLRTLVAAVQSAHVHTLELKANDTLSPRLVGELLALVTAQPFASTLRSVVVGHDIIHHHAPRVNLTLDDMQPLLHLTALKSVVLKFDMVDLTGDFVAQMLAAWPALERLELGRGARLTLAQLFVAARSNGVLRELACNVVVRAGAPLPDACGLVHDTLWRVQLDFDGSAAPVDRAAVAHLLAAVFPNLCRLGTSNQGLRVQSLMQEGERARLAGRPWSLSDYEADAINNPSRSFTMSRPVSPDA